MRSATTLLLLATLGCAPKQAPSEPAQAPAPTTVAEATGAEASESVEASRTPEVAIDDAVALLDDEASKSDIQRAIGLLEDAVTQEPDSMVARVNLGVALHRAGDLEAAQREYQAVVGQDPTIGLAWRYLGQIQREQTGVEAAENTYRSGIRNAPEDMDLRVALVDLLRTTGRVDEALTEAKAALKINANSVEIYNNMGLAYQEKGDLTLAHFVYQKALTSIPGANENARLHLNLGWTYYLQENTPRAVLELEKALEHDPHLVPALVNLSRIFLDDRNYEDTVPLLERAVEKAPEDAGVVMNLGIAYRGVGRFDDAEKQYRSVLKLRPKDPSPWLNLGILFGDYTKDYDASLNAFDTYLQAGGTEVERVEEYIKVVKREKKRVEKRKKAEEERKQREAERAERQRLLEEAEKAEPPAPAPEDDTSAPAEGEGGGETPADDGAEGAEGEPGQ